MSGGMSGGGQRARERAALARFFGPRAIAALDSSSDFVH